jgi:acyl-coenzyme A thioesterase PaaI-like protein
LKVGNSQDRQFQLAEGKSMKHTDHEYLPHSSGCFLCGDENPCGARTRFFVQDDTVRTLLVLPQHLNGYKWVAHGGVLAGLLDETMGWAATVFSQKHPFFVTGELTVKYLLPVPVGEEIEIVAHLLKDGGRIVYCQGELIYDGKECLRAKGKFLPMNNEATYAVIPYLKFDQCRKYRTLFGRVKND